MKCQILILFRLVQLGLTAVTDRFCECFPGATFNYIVLGSRVEVSYSFRSTTAVWYDLEQVFQNEKLVQSRGPALIFIEKKCLKLKHMETHQPFV